MTTPEDSAAVVDSDPAGTPDATQRSRRTGHENVVVDVVDVIMRLAAGELGARVLLPEPIVDDDLTAIGVGVNMLAEELLVLRDGLEQAVQERTKELHAVQDQLRYDADHDDLTGLANRRLLRRRLDHLIVRRRAGFALLLLDLDNFKTLNDNLGHGIGDAVLVNIAARLAGCLRQGDTAARLGGDEFAVLCCRTDTAGLRAVSQRILDEVSAPMRVEGFDVRVKASLGVVPVEHAGDAEELLRLADLAMYTAKAQGGNRACTYSAQMVDEARQRRDIEQGLRKALASDGLAVVYQPQVDARTGSLVGVEALARWPHRGGPSYPPTSFIPVAEQMGLIRELGAAVLERACRDAALWTEETGEVLRFSVNVSGQQLADGDFAEVVLQTLARTGATTGMLGLEITESLIVENQAGVEALNQLRAAGVKIAIDDFGTGYSSLSALRRLPVDTLKIDRSFVAGLGSDTDDDDSTIVRAILSLADGLQLSVIAEGVETDSQRQMLAGQGCPVLQGYLYARPMPFRELFGWAGRPTPPTGQTR